VPCPGRPQVGRRASTTVRHLHSEHVSDVRPFVLRANCGFNLPTPSRARGLHPLEAERRKTQLVDERVDHPDRVLP